MNKIKRVLARTPHICSACGGDLKEGEFVFRETVWATHKRTPQTIYYHYLPTVKPENLNYMSFDDIRSKICCQFVEKEKGG